MQKYRLYFGLLFLSFWLIPSAGCEQEPLYADKHMVLATTGIVADMVAAVGGNALNVQAVMGPGVDPHVYKASFGDLRKIRQAAIIFYNGLHLEGKMAEILEKLARQKPVYALADALPTAKLLPLQGGSQQYDPHIWLDASLWANTAHLVAEKLGQHFPKNAEYFKQNAERQSAALLALHEESKQALAAITAKNRVMITAHDAFAYFGAAYAVQVRGLQGISTVSEFGIRDVSSLVAYLISADVYAVFVESSVPQRSLEAVVKGCQQQGHDIVIGGMLYSDALGEPGTPASDYIGMFRHNVRTLVQALENKT